MSLQAGIDSVLPELRREAEARMLSAAAVLRKTGRKVQDESTGLEVPEWATVHIGPMRLAGANSGSSGTRVESTPGGEMRVGMRTAHFPASVANLAEGDLIDITAGENTGTAWKILEADFADQQTARRLPVESVQRPSEWGI